MAHDTEGRETPELAFQRSVWGCFGSGLPRWYLGSPNQGSLHTPVAEDLFARSGKLTIGSWRFVSTDTSGMMVHVAGARKKQQARIAEMLETGHSVAAIAEATGATERTVYRHKSARLKQAGDAAVREAIAAVDFQEAPALPDASARQPVTRERLIGWGYSFGLSKAEIADELGMDVAEVAIDEAAREQAYTRRVQALARMASEKPDKWMAIQERRDEAERKERMDKKVDADEVGALVEDISNHLAALFNEDDFMDWIRWVEELVKFRYPNLA